MNRRLFPLAGLAIALAVPTTQAQETEVSFRSTELSPGIHMVEAVGGFGGGNMAVLVGDTHVAMIDDSMTPLAPTLLTHVNQRVGRPVDFLINTHVHGDHVGGNAAFAGTGTVVFAHDNIRKRLLSDAGPAGGPGGLPVVTFADSVTFHLDGIEARVIHAPSAHTDGDAFVYFPADNIIHTGDVAFHNLFPYIDLENGGSVAGYIAGQEAILALADEATKIIPGHGELTDRAGLQEDLDVLKAARDKVQALLDEGKTEAQVLQENPLAEFDGRSWNFITTERMTRTLYADLSRR